MSCPNGAVPNGAVPTQTQEQFQKPVTGSIPTIIRSYKASVTYRIQKELNSTGIWQRNYYEHVIRSDDDHERIDSYIRSNIAKWSEDQENPGLVSR
jgi:REP element-mobilizing transposase RayT